MGKSGEFLGRPLGPLLKTELSLRKNVLKPLAKCVLIPLGLTAAAAATAATHKKMFGSGCPPMLASRPSDLAPCTATLLFLNEEMSNIMKIVKSLEEFGLLIKGVSQAIKNEVKEQKQGFARILLGTLGASLLRNMLAGNGVMKTGQCMIRAGQNF